jgi:2'-5' RNA ligase
MLPDGRPGGPARPEHARVFFALWPDDRLRSRLHRAAVDGARRFGGRAMQEQTLHLTLAFIGDIALDDLPKLLEAAAGVEGRVFRLILDRLGFWGHNRILWAGSHGTDPGLTQLAFSLAERLESTGYSSGIKIGRSFAPHVTLVRNVAEKQPELLPLEPMEWVCREFVLARSRLSPRGSAYEIIGRWPLRFP